MWRERDPLRTWPTPSADTVGRRAARAARAAWRGLVGRATAPDQPSYGGGSYFWWGA